MLLFAILTHNGRITACGDTDLLEESRRVHLRADARCGFSPRPIIGHTLPMSALLR
jgi:hypothetical protein